MSGSDWFYTVRELGECFMCLPKLPGTQETRMTQRDGMGREEEGGFRMGNTCIPVADSF